MLTVVPVAILDSPLNRWTPLNRSKLSLHRQAQLCQRPLSSRLRGPAGRKQRDREDRRRVETVQHSDRRVTAVLAFLRDAGLRG